jgi:hypothetical protein
MRNKKRRSRGFTLIELMILQPARATLGELDLGRIVGIDASGERHILDDAEIAAEKSKARALLQKWCS